MTITDTGLDVTGFFYGLLLGIGGYHLFLFIGAGFSRFGWFALYTLSLAGYVAVQTGDFYRWMDWNDAPMAHWILLQSLLTLTITGSIGFAYHFLRIKEHLPGWRRPLLVLGGLNVAAIPVMAVSPDPFMVEVGTAVLILVLTLVLIRLAILRIRQGQRSAWFYLVAFGVLAICLWIDIYYYYNSGFDFAPGTSAFDWQQAIARHSFEVGIIGEVFLMAFALAASINEIRRDRDKAQQAALTSAEESAALKDSYARNLQAELDERTAEVRHRNRLLSERDALRSRFFANISHELRTPLTLIRGYLKDICNGSAGTSKNGALNAALLNTKRMEDRIGELLDLSKLEAGQLKLRTQPVELHAFLKAHSESWESACRDKGISFQVNPDSVGDLEPVFIDEAKFQQVFGNLLSNALKFTPEGGSITVSAIPPKQEVPAESSDSFVGIEVRDTGAGIPAASLGHVFDRYYQVCDSDAVAAGGTGIGLALVRELTELHGGFTEVESRQGRGSIFRVWLPTGSDHLMPEEIVTHEISSIPESETKTRRAASTPSGASRKSGPKEATVLLVEDHAELRRWLSSHLRQSYRILEASDGETGLTLARQHLPDLILSDIMMPHSDGLSLLRAVRADPTIEKVPVILLTARGDDGDKLAGLEAQANDYLTKPIDADELKLRIANMLALRPPVKAPASGAVESVKARQKDADNRLLERLRKTVVEHLEDSDYAVKDLAAAHGMSESTLRRRLEEAGHRPAGLWIRKIRLETAREHLRSGSFQTVSELAAAVGFRSPAYFSRLYRTELGENPHTLLQAR